MTLTQEVVAQAAQARTTGVYLHVPAGTPLAGMASPAHVVVQGPDAARYLHSQLTNDVEGLAPGQGNLQARVLRTGHLSFVFSLHRDPEDATRFHLIVPTDQAEALVADLDGFLFADDATILPDPSLDWLIVQGPQAAATLDAVFGALGFEPWDTLPEGAIRAPRRTRKDVGIAVPEGTIALRRSLTGDMGFLVGVPAGTDALSALDAALRGAARTLGLITPDATTFDALLDILRIEAGVVRIGPETASKKRLLPETGIEQQAVSYTKGCYLGQEVIARVRTYGSVPHLLRALVLTEGRGTFDALAQGALGNLPDVGAELLDAGTGKRVGHITSRTWSPELKAPVAMAFLARDARTPGTTLTLTGLHHPFDATVVLMPLYSAPDSAARVQQLYDRAIRTFADGDEAGALAMLEQALSIDPGFADGYETIGVMLGRSGHFHEAIDVFRRLEEVAPDEPLVNTNLSLYYMKLGDKETAEDEAGKATLKSMAAARGKSIAHTVDDDLAKAKRTDAARKKAMFSQVLEFDPVDPIALFGMGNAQIVLGDYEDAEQLLARALEVDSKNSPVYAARGKALEHLSRFDEAVAVYKQGIEVASRKGDLMPLKEMQHRLLLLGGR